MDSKHTVRETNLPGLKLLSRGKVRDIYDLGDDLLIVTTDRISAFDVVMGDPIPDKGKILTRISAFWFGMTENIIPNHMISTDAGAFPPACQPYREVLEGRTMWVRKAKPLPVECIVRGYLSGSGWKEYCATGAVCRQRLPLGLKESARLTEPIFTPSTKAEEGSHDENISFEQMVKLIGEALSYTVREVSLALYRKGLDVAGPRGIIIADTKFEFGIIDGELVLIDEVLTPDSSRLWPKDQYRQGGPQPSFDKQFLRDYLESLDWGKTYPPPRLPPEVIAQTARRYQTAMKLLTS